jgi:transcriptional regulator with XRE-family HTH domain
LTPETTYKAILGRVLTQVRKDFGVEQSELASSMGVTQSTWSRIERGETSITVEQLAKASEFFQINSSTVLLDTENAIKKLKQQGVNIHYETKADSKTGKGLAMIGAAALGALVGAALSQSKEK